MMTREDFSDLRAQLVEELARLELLARFRDLEEPELARLARVRADRDAVDERLQAVRREAHRAELRQMRQQREARERHEARLAEQGAEAERRAAAAAWFRSAGRFSGDRPQPVPETMEAAKRACVDPTALEAVTVRVKRRADGEICFATPGQYLRRDFIEVERKPLDAA